MYVSLGLPERVFAPEPYFPYGSHSDALQTKVRSHHSSSQKPPMASHLI